MFYTIFPSLNYPRFSGPKSSLGNEPSNLEEHYDLEDALVVAIQMYAFIRHAYSVKMANIAQIVNVIASIFTNKEGHFLQTIFHPFEVYSTTCGDVALDVWWNCDTFSGGDHTGVRLLDVAATLNTSKKEVIVYVVNRSKDELLETEVSLSNGAEIEDVKVRVINGPDIKAQNSFDVPNEVGTRGEALSVSGSSFVYAFEPHSVTALICSP